MSESKKNSYLHGAAILAAGTVIVKIIGAIYKLPLYNILGREGTSYFSVAYNIYAVLLTISTAGLPVALSKMISAANALDRPNQIKKVFFVGRFAFLTVGLIGTLIMFLFPQQIAQIIGGKGNDGAWYSIRALSPALFCICLTSAYRGYFQGHGNMIPTAITQIIEAFSKLVFGLSLAWWLISIGQDETVASAGAITGVSIGTVLAIAYMLVYKNRNDKRKVRLESKGDSPDSGRKIIARILSIGIPITLSSSFLSIINLMDTALILNRLQSALGMAKELANGLQGTYSMVLTFYNVPPAIILPVTISFIPAITSFLARKEYGEAAKVTESGLKMTNLIAMPAGVGLSSLSLGIITAAYSKAGPEGPGILAYMGIASTLVCIMLMTNSILQAYGHERYTVYTVVVGGIIKIGTNWVLLGMESIGIYGAAIATVVCYLIIDVLNLAIIMKKVPQKPNLIRAYVKPILCTAVMAVAAYSCYALFARWFGSVLTQPIGGIDPERFVAIVSVAGAVIIAVIIYLALIITTGALTAEDLEMLPKGKKLAKRLKR